MPDGSAPFLPSQILRGKRLFLLGGTGFLGKVTLSMLLDRFPEVGRIHLMVRPGSGESPAQRFWDRVLPSPAFHPLRERYGGELRAFLESKLSIVGGDVVKPNLGLTDDEAGRIAGDSDVLLNISGKVDFNPPLETSLRTNVTGTRHTLAFAKRLPRPAYIHLSTAFVAGNRSGEVWEDEPLAGYTPRRARGEDDPGFSAEDEIAACEGLSARVRDEADDPLRLALLREAARQRLVEEGRDPDDESQLKLAIARERKNWIRDRLSSAGVERARGWGWPNIYTYCKSLGEQLVAAETGVRSAIIRPSIVESAVSFPFPGWNEGFNTSAPLIRAALKGSPYVPADPTVILDFIPVDHVAAAILAVTALATEETPAHVYQLASGDRNPLTMDRVVTLTGLAKRRHFQRKASGSRLVNEILARAESRVVEARHHENLFEPAARAALDRVTDLLSRARTRVPGPLGQLVGQLRDRAQDLDDFVARGEGDYRTFRPFIVENRYVFRCDHIRALRDRMPESERSQIPFHPETIDWHAYMLDVHVPGLEKWIFPQLERAEASDVRRVYTYGTLIEMFDTTTKLHGGRVAMRIERDGREERYTYADLRECVLRAAAFLRRRGVGLGSRVALLSENRPEWPMAYFGVVKTGATAIPLERELSTPEIVNLLRAGEASGLVLSPEQRRRHAKLDERLAAAGLDLPVWTFDDVFAVGDEADERLAIAELPTDVPGSTLASLIFTSGTTGTPKGVMLTHRNFATLLSKLLSVFDFTHEDGMLSVLPLHHSFEFTAGLLLPLSRGAQITYVAKLSEENLRRELKKGHTTALVGVPALWEVLKRGVDKRIHEMGEGVRWVFELLRDANLALWEETGVNLGPLLFLPVHQGFGGRIRFLISGGAALPQDVAETFRGYGFVLLEGYGLTEASPVLTCTRPGKFPPRGSVGPALPGIELRVLTPDRRGVGEIVARGPNVMAGYWKNEAATREAIPDGWLRTGDLGRLDDDGNLFLVGRAKEVIIGASGKNVYPDELEELYGAVPDVKELCVVGLPEADGGERIACLAVAAGDDAEERAASEVRARDHFRRVSSTLPSFKRVRVVEFTDQELPRTATRKAKRRDVRDLLERRLAERGHARGGRADDRDRGEDEAAPVQIPREIARLVSGALDAGQHFAMTNYFQPTIRGASNIPPHVNFLVAANHSSHLDHSLVKLALGDAGRDLVALAAADYWFGSRAKRAFFENFTNLVPLDRKGSLRRSFETALELLRAGRNVLLFPEGTRTRSGELLPFQRGLGFILLRAKAGVLPVHLNTYDALPPGSLLPRQRELTATIGPFLSAERLAELTGGLPSGQAERLVTAYVQSIVEALRDRREPILDLDEARRTFMPERRASRVPAGAAADEAEA